MKKSYIPKKYQSLYNETARLRILEVLFRFPDKEFSLSDLARGARVAKTNISSILEDFHSAGLIGITKLRTIWRIRANQKNPDFIKNKIVHNLSFVYQSGLADALNEYFKYPKAIIIFGSFRKGEDISNSDIDIAVESAEAKESKTIGLRELSDFEKMIGRKIQIHLFNRKNIDINVFNNIANGIVLSGFLEVSP